MPAVEPDARQAGGGGADRIRPEECVYIGDRLGTDAIGAAKAGMTGVWLDRGRVAAQPADVAEARRLGVPVLNGLGELPGLLLDRTEAA